MELRILRTTFEPPTDAEVLGLMDRTGMSKAQAYHTLRRPETNVFQFRNDLGEWEDVPTVTTHKP